MARKTADMRDQNVIETEGLGEGLTCDQWMPLLLPYLREELVDVTAAERLRTLARRVPGGAMGAIELRLAPGQSQVDLSFRIAGPIQARQFASLLEPPYVKKFFADWATDPDPRIPFLWVEFDLDDDPDESLWPVFAARLDGEIEEDWLIETLLPGLIGSPPTAAQQRLVRRCLAAAGDPRPQIVYVANLQTRGMSAIRLDYYGMPPRNIAAYLERLGRPDLASTVSPLEKLVGGGERFHFSHDLDTGLLPRLGVELSYNSWPRRGEPQWEGLFDRLLDAGLCTPEKRDALFAWPGYVSADSVADLWPDQAGARGHLVRNFSHVKLVCHPEREIEAKAYLLFGHYFRTPEGNLSLRMD